MSRTLMPLPFLFLAAKSISWALWVKETDTGSDLGP
jgi:hypothetical protein